jgi:hypothetical protein
MAKFSKGVSGNPGGRPKVLCEVQELARQYAPSAIAELARLALKAKSETARIAAIRELLDRGYGRARQAMEVSAPVGDPLDLLRLMMEEIDVIERKRTYNQVPKEPAAGRSLLLAGSSSAPCEISTRGK